LRKIYIFIILLILSGCDSTSTTEQQWDTYDIRPITDIGSNNENDNCILDCDFPIKSDLIHEDISGFKLGMSREDILEKIGRPHILFGSGFWIDLYVIDGDNALFYYTMDDEVVVLESLVVCSSTDCKKLK